MSLCSLLSALCSLLSADVPVVCKYLCIWSFLLYDEQIDPEHNSNGSNRRTGHTMQVGDAGGMLCRGRGNSGLCLHPLATTHGVFPYHLATSTKHLVMSSHAGMEYKKWLWRL